VTQLGYPLLVIWISRFWKKIKRSWRQIALYEVVIGVPSYHHSPGERFGGYKATSQWKLMRFTELW
jgi:hypothetical protein